MNSFDTKVTIRTIINDIKKSDSAIKEAIANSIDAKSKNVYVKVYEEKIKDNIININYICLDIADDGEGITTNKEKFEEVFCQYKVSTKQQKSQYGKKGKGRYTYLTLTKDSQNINIFTKNTDNEIFKINFECKNNENIKIIQDIYQHKINTPIKKHFTTIVQFKNLDEEKFNVKKNTKEEILQDIKNEIISFFADAIASKNINIYLNDELLDVANYLEDDIVSQNISIKDNKFKIDFYVWNDKVRLKADRQKHILFFDNKGILKGILPSGKHKIAFSGHTRDHSIIVKSNYFNELDYVVDENENLFTDDNVMELKKKIELELEQILFEIYKKNIDTISEEYISFLKISEDEITQNVYHALLLPFIEKFGNKKSIPKELKSIIAKLINILASEAPDSFINNLSTILNLSNEDSKKIEYIQNNYGIVKSITEKEKIIKRIDFLNKFDELVNGKNRKNVQERTELHKIVEKNLWLISDKFENISYSQIASDISLKTILENENFYQFDSDELEKIAKEHKLEKIPDIFIPIEKDNIIYIIELKKPTIKINYKILNEIREKYVKTIKQINKKFESKNKKIYAIAISDDKTEDVYPIGNIDTHDIYINPLCWIELIEKARTNCNKKIEQLNNKLKSSHWKSLEDFILSHKE